MHVKVINSMKISEDGLKMMCKRPKEFEDVVARKVGESKAKFMLKSIAKGVTIIVFYAEAVCTLFIVERFIKTNTIAFINIRKK